MDAIAANLLSYLNNPATAYPIMAVLGLCFGSYVTLLSWRLPRDLPTIATRSRCPSCQMALKAIDLIPVFSYLLSGGKCRGCKTKLSPRYPLTELATAAGFVWAFSAAGVGWPLLCLLALWVCLMVLIVTDLEHYIIPDQVQLGIFVAGAAYQLLSGGDFGAAVVGALAGGAIGLTLRYGFLYLRNKDGLGMGDVKLMAASGIWIGAQTMVPYLFYAGLIGILTAIVWRLLGRGERYPFGPSLALSLWVLALHPSSADVFWNLFRI